MVEILVVLLVVVVALYLLNTYLPLPPPIKTIVNIVVVVLALVWLLDGCGAFGTMHWRGHWR